jgi:hypothetical protein
VGRPADLPAHVASICDLLRPTGPFNRWLPNRIVRTIRAALLPGSDRGALLRFRGPPLPDPGARLPRRRPRHLPAVRPRPGLGRERVGCPDCTLQRGGQRVELTDPIMFSGGDAMALVPAPMRAGLRLLRVTQARVAASRHPWGRGRAAGAGTTGPGWRRPQPRRPGPAPVGGGEAGQAGVAPGQVAPGEGAGEQGQGRDVGVRRTPSRLVRIQATRKLAAAMTESQPRAPSQEIAA